jgi:hypothetical protein
MMRHRFPHDTDFPTGLCRRCQVAQNAVSLFLSTGKRVRSRKGAVSMAEHSKHQYGVLVKPVGREKFLDRLAADFPEAAAGMRSDEAGLLHCEVAAFRRATEAAMDAGRLWEAEGHFRLVEQMLAVAGPELREALEVSYLEDLALGECTAARHRAVKERMPHALRQMLIGHHQQWR